jgi:hypothetical protein
MGSYELYAKLTVEIARVTGMLQRRMNDQLRMKNKNVWKVKGMNDERLNPLL